MSTLLHVNTSPRGDHSISRQITAGAVRIWKEKNPDGKVIERDLAKSHLSFVDLDWIMGAFTPPDQQAESHKEALAISDELIAELLEADVIVIGTPMYNFAIPALLKAWIDHVVRAGKTFAYGEKGPQGLAGGRKAVIAVASGGSYEGTSFEPYDHEIPYLRHIFGFIGITDVSFIRAGDTKAVMQGKISAPEFLAPHFERAAALL